MAAKAVAPSSWPRVVLFGDSLTQFGYSEEGCWVARLADAMQRRSVMKGDHSEDDLFPSRKS